MRGAFRMVTLIHTIHVIHNTIAWEHHHMFGIIAHNNNYYIWCQVVFNALIATAGLSLF